MGSRPAHVLPGDFTLPLPLLRTVGVSRSLPLRSASWPWEWERERCTCEGEGVRGAVLTTARGALSLGIDQGQS